MYCDHCKVKIIGKETTCPLCQNGLEKKEKPTKSIFPHVPTVLEQHHLLFKILMSISIATALISLFINYLVSTKVWWSLFVILGIISVWTSLITTIKKRNNLSKAIFYQALIIVVFSIVWDFATVWHGWSIDYVLPTVATMTMIGLAVIQIVTKIKPKSTIIYFLIICLIGILPLVFLVTDLVHVNYPSIICVITTSIFLSTIIIFNGKEMQEELKRRLHL